MKKISLPVIFIIVTMLSGCQKLTDFYIGIPEQPDFKQSEFQKGMNIMGILRPDNKDSINMSFVYIQKVLPATSDFSEELKIIDATVKIYTPGTGDSIQFTYDNPYLAFSDSMYRPLMTFQPQTGKVYGVICHYPGLPDAVGETRMPDPPAIDLASAKITGSTFTFSVKPDTTIKLLDVYLIGPKSSAFLNRIVPTDTSSTTIQVDITGLSSGSILRVFGYDDNLAAYYANTNTSLNLNKFRTTYSTLISGYGVFGALNYSDVKLP